MLLLVTATSATSGQQPPEAGKAGRPADPDATQQTARELKKLYDDTYAPRRTPDRIILTWNGDPATTQAVTWRTDTSVTTPLAQIALSEPGPAFDGYGTKTRPNPEKVKTVEGKTERLKSELYEAHYHSVVFTGLKPKTRYLYRVGDGAVWSEWFEFRTASDQPERLQFIYLGDAQNEVKSLWSRVVRGAYSDMPKAQFILHAGDLINRANADGEWGEWHAAAGWINAMIPSIPTPGNHEYAAPTGATAVLGGLRKTRLSQNWRPQFTLPENGPTGLEETTYYLDIQGVRIVSLNSNEMQEEQVPWLESVLANNPNRWTIVTFHHPIYSTARGRDNKKLRELWRPVFDKYTPDLVLQGHDHTYARSGVMREDNLLTGARLRDERGTVYVVSVSGPKMYTLEPAPWMESKAADTQLYQLITIDGDTLHYEARTADGVLYDAFDLKKSPAPGPAADSSGLSNVPVWVTVGVFGGVLLLFVVRLAVRRLAT